MVSIIRVQPEELTADALGLADAQMPITPPLGVPLAADPVSQGVSALCDSHSGALAMTVEHSGALRAHGSTVLSQAAAALRNADDENAAMLAAGTARRDAAPGAGDDSPADAFARPAVTGIVAPDDRPMMFALLTFFILGPIGVAAAAIAQPRTVSEPPPIADGRRRFTCPRCGADNDILARDTSYDCWRCSEHRNVKPPIKPTPETRMH